jgi:hypothetical protein
MSYRHPKVNILYKLKSDHDEVELETTQKTAFLRIRAVKKRDTVVHFF